MIFGNEPISKVKPNSKKGFGDYPNLSSYIRERNNFFLQDLAESIDIPKANRAFKFLSDFERSDEFTKEALAGGYGTAENVIIDLRQKIEIYKQNEEKKNDQDNQDRLKALELSKDIFDTKIKSLFESIDKEFIELHKIPGFRSYMIEDQLENALISLTKSAKVMINKFKI